LQMSDLGRFLVIAGVALTVMGVILWSGFGRSWLVRLPGDIHYTRGNFSFYFPVVACLVLSIVLTFILWLFKR